MEPPAFPAGNGKLEIASPLHNRTNSSQLIHKIFTFLEPISEQRLGKPPRLTFKDSHTSKEKVDMSLAHT